MVASRYGRRDATTLRGARYRPRKLRDEQDDEDTSSNDQHTHAWDDQSAPSHQMSRSVRSTPWSPTKSLSSTMTARSKNSSKKSNKYSSYLRSMASNRRKDNKGRRFRALAASDSYNPAIDSSSAHSSFEDSQSQVSRRSVLSGTELLENASSLSGSSFETIEEDICGNSEVVLRNSPSVKSRGSRGGRKGSSRTRSSDDVALLGPSSRLRTCSEAIDKEEEDDLSIFEPPGSTGSRKGRSGKKSINEDEQSIDADTLPLLTKSSDDSSSIEDENAPLQAPPRGRRTGGYAPIQEETSPLRTSPKPQPSEPQKLETLDRGNYDQLSDEGGAIELQVPTTATPNRSKVRFSPARDCDVGEQTASSQSSGESSPEAVQEASFEDFVPSFSASNNGAPADGQPERIISAPFRPGSPVNPGLLDGSAATYFRKKHQKIILSEYERHLNITGGKSYSVDVLAEVSKQSSYAARSRAQIAAEEDALELDIEEQEDAKEDMEDNGAEEEEKEELEERETSAVEETVQVIEQAAEECPHVQEVPSLGPNDVGSVAEPSCFVSRLGIAPFSFDRICEAMECGWKGSVAQ